MLDQEGILRAVRSLQQGAAGLPGTSRRAWLNRAFTPPQTGTPGDPDPWIEESLTVIGERHASTQLLEFNGIVTYRCHVQQGAGHEPAARLAKTVGDLYVPGTSIQHNGVNVHVYRCEPGSGQHRDDTWYYVPVLVYIRSFGITNN